MGFLKNLLGRGEYAVTAMPADLRFTARAGQSVLESALAQGIAFPHSCTVGTCGACKCHLKAGKIREITNFAYVLDAAELRSGVILACQAEPRSDLTLEVPGLVAKRLHPVSDYDGAIDDVTTLTPDIERVTVRLDRPMAFDAGQYATLEAPGIHGARAYSMANPPTPGGDTQLTFIIRHVPGGLFTDALFKGDLAGVPLRVRGPAGNFWLRDSREPLIAIAGGSGLAPLLSMLGDAAERQVGRPCVVMFGARRQADLYALDTLAAFARKWNGTFEFVAVLAEEPADSDWQGARGLVTEEIATRVRPYASSGTEAYLCGPPGMVDAATRALCALGIELGNVHFDKFLDGSHGLQRQSHD